jgi:ankyrin repeat protein
VEIASMLVDRGADVRATTRSWSREIDAAYLAGSSGNREMFEWLLDHGADPHGALVAALWRKRADWAELALAHGADPDRAVDSGRPLLNELTRWGQVEPALWLLARGASPNLPDARGWTAVHQAASRGNERLLRAILDAGGDASRRDAQGLTPRDVVNARHRERLLSAVTRALRS